MYKNMRRNLAILALSVGCLSLVGCTAGIGVGGPYYHDGYWGSPYYYHNSYYHGYNHGYNEGYYNGSHHAKS